MKTFLNKYERHKLNSSHVESIRFGSGGYHLHVPEINRWVEHMEHPETDIM